MMILDFLGITDELNLDLAKRPDGTSRVFSTFHNWPRSGPMEFETWIQLEKTALSNRGSR